MHLESPGIHSLGHTLHSSVNSLVLIYCSLFNHNLHHLNGTHDQTAPEVPDEWHGLRAGFLSLLPKPSSNPYRQVLIRQPPRFSTLASSGRRAPRCAGPALPARPQGNLPPTDIPAALPSSKMHAPAEGLSQELRSAKRKEVSQSQSNVNTIKTTKSS